MATDKAVNRGSKFCRHCGLPTVTKGNLTWCDNGRGSVHCDNLTMHSRLFCEHCGHATQGPGKCPNCKKAPTKP